MTVADLERAARLEKSGTDAHYALGLALVRSNRYQDAAHAFLAVLDREPARADALNDLGVCYLFQRRYYEALVALQGATAARPNFAPAYANLGRLHLATKMSYTAVRELEKAVQLDGSSTETLCDLGEAYQQTLNLKGALQIYDRAVKQDHKSSAAYIGLGRTLLSLGRYSDAEAALNRTLKISPEEPVALVALGKIRSQTAPGPADLQAALALFERAARADPDDAEARYNIGSILLRQGKPGPAIAALSTALRLAPQHQGVLHDLERALRAAGRTADADRMGKVFETRALREREETRLEEHIAHNPSDFEARVRLGLSYVESGNRGMALLICRQVQDNAPQTSGLPNLLRALNLQAAPARTVR